MTWQTPDGDRELEGAEAELVRDVLAIMVDKISEDVRYGDQFPNHEFGGDGFDSLSPTEKLGTIKAVAEHLLTKTPATLELVSVNEAAVYAVFVTLNAEIEMEIDVEADPNMDDDDPEWRVYWRVRTLKAHQECFADEMDDEEFAGDDPESPWMVPRDPNSRNAEQWEAMTESLADRILWDRDFEMADSFMDTDPAKAQAMKQMLGIENDYYSRVSPEIAADQVESTLESVRKITHRKPRRSKSACTP